MIRRLLLAPALLVPLAAAAAASPTVTPPPYSGPLMSHPLKACAQVTDASGDASPVIAGPLTTGPDSTVDLTGVSMRTSPTTLDAFVSVSGLTRNTNFVGWSRYDIFTSFVVNGKTVVLDASQDRPTTATVGGTAAGLLKPTAVFDFQHSGVLFSVDRAGLAASVGAALPADTQITAIQASSTVTSLLELATRDADSATTGSRTYSLGDNTCFIPPAGTITLSMPDSGQYTDTVRITATFLDAAGKPAAREKLDAYLGATMTPGASEFTDDNGVAVLDLPLDRVDDVVSVAFEGDTEIGRTFAGQLFTVTPERTRITATPGRGTVKATVLDDDGEPVADAPVTFTEGRRTFVLYTGTSGATIYKTVRGSLVKVSYAGKRDYYLAAGSASTRAQ